MTCLDIEASKHTSMTCVNLPGSLRQASAAVELPVEPPVEWPSEAAADLKCIDRVELLDVLRI
jgi:hypothetical protein